MKTALKTFFVVGLAIALGACAGEGSKTELEQQKAEIGKIKVVADEAMQPLIDAEKNAYEGTYPDIKILLKYLPEQEAIQAMLNDSARVAVTTRELSEKEQEYLKQNKIYFETEKIAIDAIALITNKNNKDTLVTMSELKDLFSGKKTKWSELKNGKSKEKITLIFDHSNSSNLNFMTEKLDIANKKDVPYFSVKSNKEVIEYVKSHVNAIGVIGVNWISDGDDPQSMAFSKDLNVMSVAEVQSAKTSEYYLPFAYNLALQRYPLRRSIYMITKHTRNSFINFCGKDKGQLIVLKAGLLPATQPVRLVNVTQ